MRWDDAGLHAKANQGQYEHRGTKRLMVLQSSTIGGEIGGSCNRAEQHEQNQQERRSEVRGREIGPGGMPDGRLAVVEYDQKERAQRHDLPGQKKQQPVPRHDHQRHRGREHVEMEPACRRCESAAVGKVAAAVKPGHDRQAEDGQQKERGQNVDFEVQAAARHVPGARQAHGIAGHEHAERGNEPASGPQHRAGLAGELT
jgi:hypothetical protein